MSEDPTEPEESPETPAPDADPEAADPNAPVANFATDGRSRAGCVFLILPLIFAMLIMSGYIVLFGVGSLGFAAGGERIRLTIDTCDEARPVIQSRVDMMGLGRPIYEETEGGWAVEVTLPDTPAAASIPHTLTRRGDFAIRAGDTIEAPTVLTHEDIKKAEFSLKELGNPLVVVTMTRSAHKRLEAHMEAESEGQIAMWVDTERVVVRPNDPPFRRQAIDIRAEGPDGQDNMTRAVNWALVMTHGPLPCDATIASERTL